MVQALQRVNKEQLEVLKVVLFRVMIYVQPVSFWWPVRCSNRWSTWTEMISEGYICVQPVTFWSPVKCSNHRATWTEMMSEGYICVQPVTFWSPVRCSNHRATWTIIKMFTLQQLWQMIEFFSLILFTRETTASTTKKL